MSSTETVAARQPATGRADPPQPVFATRAQDLATVIFGSWIVLGVFTDAWAHVNILSDIQEEGFFTPWHGLLYSGFAATAAWTFWLAFRRRREVDRWWVNGWPVGYRLGAIGAAFFLVAGNLDMVWHTVFGVESTIDALLSPSHLLLSLGATILLTSPTRSWWATGEGGMRSVTGMIALGMGVFTTGIFLLYGSAFDVVAAVQPFDGAQDSAGYSLAALGVTSYLITAATAAVPLLMSHRRRSTFGVVTAVVTPLVLFAAVTREFPRVETAALLAVVPATLLADWILVRLDRTRGFDAPLRLPIAGATVGALVSAAHLVALQFAEGVTWPVELWTGSVVMAAVVGALLGGLASRPADVVRSLR